MQTVFALFSLLRECMLGMSRFSLTSLRQISIYGRCDTCRKITVKAGRIRPILEPIVSALKRGILVDLQLSFSFTVTFLQLVGALHCVHVSGIHLFCCILAMPYAACGRNVQTYKIELVNCRDEM